MKAELIDRINTQIALIEIYIADDRGHQMESKDNPSHWSKKEILGHLIDSATNNIKRFSEVQFSPRPYSVYSYNQDELVRVNAYNQMRVAQVFALWKELNLFVAHIIDIQSFETLAFEVMINKTQEIRTLSWLMTDYVEHLEHHCKQILG